MRATAGDQGVEDWVGRQARIGEPCVESRAYLFYTTHHVWFRNGPRSVGLPPISPPHPKLTSMCHPDYASPVLA